MAVFYIGTNFPNTRPSISSCFQYFGGKLSSIDWKLNKFSDAFIFTKFFFCREIFQKYTELKHVLFGGHFFTSKNFLKNRDFPLIWSASKKSRWKKFEKKNAAINSWRPTLQCCCCSEIHNSLAKNSKSIITESLFFENIALWI